MPGPKSPNTDDFDGEDRLYLALNMKEGLTPSGVFEDWGDSEVDHPIESRTDVHYSSADETEDYYESLRRDTFKLRDHEE